MPTRLRTRPVLFDAAVPIVRPARWADDPTRSSPAPRVRVWRAPSDVTVLIARPIRRTGAVTRSTAVIRMLSFIAGYPLRLTGPEQQILGIQLPQFGRLEAEGLRKIA